MKRLIFFCLIIGSLSLVSYTIPGKIEKDTIQIAPGLRMAKTEVSNQEYKQFLTYLRKTNERLYKTYYPDSIAWRSVSPTNQEPLVLSYFNNPGFNNYPVVGISHEAAVAFCQWATAVAMKSETIGKDRKQLKEPANKIIYRLPTKTEWESAAKLNSLDAVYAGGWRSVKGKAKENKVPNGYYFNHQVAKNNYYADGFSYTAPVDKSDKKDFQINMIKADKNGFYHLAGNVAEMIAEKGISVGGNWYDLEDKARIGVTDTYTEPNAKTGFRYIIEIKNK